MPSTNKEVLKRHRDAWYSKNKDKQKKAQQQRRANLKAEYQKYKQSLNCTDCGMSFEDCPECCDFHHLDPDIKDMNISKIVLNSAKALVIELDKCIPLCANCHRIRHRSN